MSLSRVGIHKLVDVLPDNELIVALRFLHFLAMQVGKIPDDLQAEIDLLLGNETALESLELLKTHLYSEK